MRVAQIWSHRNTLLATVGIKNETELELLEISLATWQSEGEALKACRPDDALEYFLSLRGLEIIHIENYWETGETCKAEHGSAS